MRFPVKTAWYPSRNTVSAKKRSWLPPLFLIIAPIYQRIWHLLGAGPVATHYACLCGV